mgnify:CR=1 FL=1
MKKNTYICIRMYTLTLMICTNANDIEILDETLLAEHEFREQRSGRDVFCNMPCVYCRINNHKQLPYRG